MFHSETLAWAIHADRVRDLERKAREHRLLVAADEPVAPAQAVSRAPIAAPTKRPACGDSAGLPA